MIENQDTPIIECVTDLLATINTFAHPSLLTTHQPSATPHPINMGQSTSKRNLTSTSLGTTSASCCTLILTSTVEGHIYRTQTITLPREVWVE